MRQCCTIADLIYPCIQDGSVLRMKMNDPALLKVIHDQHNEDDEKEEFEEETKSATTTVMIRHGRKRKYVEIEHEQQNTLLNAKVINDITKSKQQCVVVLKKLLYKKLNVIKTELNVLKKKLELMRQIELTQQHAIKYRLNRRR
jgi:hypothetical protein